MVLNRRLIKTALTLFFCQSFMIEGNCSTVSVNQKNSNITHLSENFKKRIDTAQSLLNKGTSEALIKKAFSSQEFEIIEHMRFKKEMADIDHSPTYLYAHLAAIGGSASAQEKWSESLLGQRRYNEAAKWYILAALNGHADCRSYLNDLTNNEEYRNNPKQSLQRNLADYWEKIYSNDDIKRSTLTPNPLIEKE